MFPILETDCNIKHEYLLDYYTLEGVPEPLDLVAAFIRRFNFVPLPWQNSGLMHAQQLSM